MAIKNDSFPTFGTFVEPETFIDQEFARLSMVTVASSIHSDTSIAELESMLAWCDEQLESVEVIEVA